MGDAVPGVAAAQEEVVAVEMAVAVAAEANSEFIAWEAVWSSIPASCTVQPKRVGLLSLEIKVGRRSLGWVGRAPISLDGAVPTARSGPPSGEK